MLISNGYRFAYFDSLNRYYAAEERPRLGRAAQAAPDSFDGAIQFRTFEPALDDASHPDHLLARVLAGLDMVRLPLLPIAELVERLTGGLDPAGLDRAADAGEVAAAHQTAVRSARHAAMGRQLSDCPRGNRPRSLLQRGRRLAPFRAACGRISASSAW